jgi:hypothetical protein
MVSAKTKQCSFHAIHEHMANPSPRVPHYILHKIGTLMSNGLSDVPYLNNLPTLGSVLL